MFRKNDVENIQLSLISKENSWSEYMKKRVEKSWAGYFRDSILPSIDESEYKVLYSEKSSRPNTPVNYMIGLLIIKSLNNLSDDELLDEALFNQKVQYALGTIDYDKQPISKNMISNFRVRINEYERETGINLFENTMKKINKKIIQAANIDKSLKRMDSLMISSSCKKMTRTELIYKVNERFIKMLNKSQKEIDDELKNYLNEDNKVDVLYRIKEEEIGGKLTLLLNDSIKLYNKYREDEEILETEEFKQLKRLIEDQYDETKKKPKDGKEIKPTSMQSPYDEDSTYRFKYKGNIGYVGNIEEAVDTKKELALITDWDVAPNVKSDKEFMEEKIEKKETDEEETIIVDAAYYSTELNEKAKEKNIQLHPTDMTGKKDIKETNLDEFEIEENNKITKCPAGNKPIESKYSESKNMVYADFDKELCMQCPYYEKCAVQKFSTKTKLCTSIGQIEFAKLRKNRNTEEYKKISRLRSGIEGIPSVLRRKYRIDDRKTKGVVCLKNKLSSAIISINIKRIVKYMVKIHCTKMILKLKQEFYFFLEKIRNKILVSYLTQF